MKRFFLIALVALLSFTMTATAQAGILNDFQATLTGPDLNILTRSLNLASELFGALFVATVCVNITRGIIHNRTIEGWAWILGETFMAMIPPLVVLNGARVVLPNLAGLIAQLAGTITGYPAAANGPDGIITIAINTMGTILHAATAPLTNPGPLGLVLGADKTIMALFNLGAAVFACSIIFSSLGWLAFELMFSFVNALFLVSVGAVQIAWVASPNTQHMAGQYAGAVCAAVWRCVVIIAWATTVSSLLTPFVAAFTADLNNPILFLQALVQITAISFVAGVGTSKIGNAGDAIFSGQPFFTAGEVLREAKTTLRRFVPV